MVVFLYWLAPEFSVSFNRSLEMMKSGSEKGLMMIYYQFDNLAFLFAAFYLMPCNYLIMVIHNTSVITACLWFV